MSSTSISRKLVERNIGGKLLSIETGHLAKQATGSVVVRIGDTMTLVAVVLGWLVSGRVLAPLRTITRATRNISASNLSRRLSITGRDDEFAELGETLDDLFTRLEASFQAQRHFVANASHELRTPLTAERTLL